MKMDERRLADAKLAIALELYRTFFSEPLAHGKLIVLMTVLEVLAERRKRPPVVQDLLRQFVDRAEQMAAALATGSEEATALESLRRELDFRKEDSIRSSIGRLVRDTLSDDPDVVALSQTAVRAYDARSTLVHDGVLPDADVTRALDSVWPIAKRLLVARASAVGGDLG